MEAVTLGCILAVALDRWLGEPVRWHPLVGFGRLVQGVEAWCYGPAELSAGARRRRGVLAVLLLLVPAALLAAALGAIPWLGWLLGVVLLYLAIGARSLEQHARAVHDALQAGDLALARERVSWIVSRDTAELDEEGISLATVESVLENGCDAIFGTLFWYVAAGAPGVVLYRLANTLDAMWGYKNERYRHFGWAAARLDDALNWLPARLTAFTYTVLGDRRRAWRCWQSQGCHWKSPNAGPVMAAGAGALRLQLGGRARYFGRDVQRPPLGEGLAPRAMDIERALRLVRHSLRLWLGVLLVLALLLR
ncbi:MAG TPA: adenosylcobinamide-phosphate synthase CbiB [Candidatus Competibacteraceae bacterium]|nr:adenosylcobinamide-phosphate synthase CbiB [Candidatus Competibacteraceae bacterium]